MKKKAVIKEVFLYTLLAIILTFISFMFTHEVFELNYLNLYMDFSLFLINMIPILILLILFRLIFNRLYISYLVTSFLILILGIVNQSKIIYRNDIVKFEDIFLFKEALIMSRRYDIVIKKYTIVLIIFVIVSSIIIKKFFKDKKLNKKVRFFAIILIVIISILGYKTVYLNDKIYDSLGNSEGTNKWVEMEQSQIKGLIYPYVHSIKDIKEEKPKTYNKNKAKKVLNSYEYESIPDDKKVNFVSIMLEAYNDFSKFDEIKFTIDPYKDLHEIEKNSIHGKLVTNIFGGGTIETERKYLTGYNKLTNLRKLSNSYVWYFKNEGYRTGGLHPIEGSFYNRKTINSNLGFDNYRFFQDELHADDMSEPEYYNYTRDNLLFDYIINDYNKYKNKPYFQFSVTYQNHGPYSDKKDSNTNYYFKNPGISKESYNTINNYFTGVENTTKELKKLIKKFDEDKKPVVLVLFGDHNPALGKAYEELNINIDLDTTEGYENYYETLYIIHLNDAAKKLLNKNAVGEGDMISSNYLMNEVFEQIGFKGNEYLNYTTEVKNLYPVVSDEYYYNANKGKFLRNKPNKKNKTIDQFTNVSYYYSKYFNRNKK